MTPVPKRSMPLWSIALSQIESQNLERQAVKGLSIFSPRKPVIANKYFPGNFSLEPIGYRLANIIVAWQKPDNHQGNGEAQHSGKDRGSNWVLPSHAR